MSHEKSKSSRQGANRKQRGSPPPRAAAGRSTGGELHQVAGEHHPALTTNQGVVRSDNQNSLQGHSS